MNARRMLLAIAAVPLLAGCGGSSTDSTTAATGAESPDVTSTTATSPATSQGAATSTSPTSPPSSSSAASSSSGVQPGSSATAPASDGSASAGASGTGSCTSPGDGTTDTHGKTIPYFVIETHGMSCTEAKQVLAKYQRQPAAQGNNINYQEFDGWACSMMTAVNASQQNNYTSCDHKQDHRSFTLKAPPA